MRVDDMDVIVWGAVSQLPSSVKKIVDEADLRNDQHKFHIKPPSGIIGGYVMLFGLLFFGAAVFAGHSLFVRQQVVYSGLKITAAVFFMVAGALCIYAGIRMDIKRFFQKRYYLFLTNEYLVERSFRRVTFIPREKLLYAFERRGKGQGEDGVYFDCLVIQDTSGEKKAYDLNDHYFLDRGAWRNAVGHDRLYKVVKRYYKLPSLPQSEKVI